MSSCDLSLLLTLNDAPGKSCCVCPLGCGWSRGALGQSSQWWGELRGVRQLTAQKKTDLRPRKKKCSDELVSLESDLKCWYELSHSKVSISINLKIAKHITVIILSPTFFELVRLRGFPAESPQSLSMFRCEGGVFKSGNWMKQRAQKMFSGVRIAWVSRTGTTSVHHHLMKQFYYCIDLYMDLTYCFDQVGTHMFFPDRCWWIFLLLQLISGGPLACQGAPD